MELTSPLAAQGYGAARNAVAPGDAPSGQGGPGFAELAGSLAHSLRQGEATAMAALSGEAGPHALVAALAETELAVETAVTVRDRVVEAYQEILRMPV